MTMSLFVCWNSIHKSQLWMTCSVNIPNQNIYSNPQFWKLQRVSNINFLLFLLLVSHFFISMNVYWIYLRGITNFQIVLKIPKICCYFKTLKSFGGRAIYFNKCSTTCATASLWSKIQNDNMETHEKRQNGTQKSTRW